MQSEELIRLNPKKYEYCKKCGQVILSKKHICTVQLERKEVERYGRFKSTD